MEVGGWLPGGNSSSFRIAHALTWQTEWVEWAGWTPTFLKGEDRRIFLRLEETVKFSRPDQKENIRSRECYLRVRYYYILRKEVKNLIWCSRPSGKHSAQRCRFQPRRWYETELDAVPYPEDSLSPCGTGTTCIFCSCTRYGMPSDILCFLTQPTPPFRKYHTPSTLEFPDFLREGFPGKKKKLRVNSSSAFSGRVDKHASQFPSE